MYDLVIQIVSGSGDDEFWSELIDSFTTISRAVGAVREYVSTECTGKFTYRKYKVRSVGRNGVPLAWRYDPKTDQLFKIVLFKSEDYEEDGDYEDNEDNEPEDKYEYEEDTEGNLWLHKVTPPTEIPAIDKALFLAIRRGDLGTVKTLLENTSGVDTEGALVVAAEEGHLDIVDFLLDSSIAFDDDEINEALQGAAGGHYEVVLRMLEDKRVDPSAEDSYALQVAAAAGEYYTVVELLRDPRVNPSADNNAALLAAAKNGHYQIIERLVEAQQKRTLPIIS